MTIELMLEICGVLLHRLPQNRLIPCIWHLVAEFYKKTDIPKEICNIADGTVYMPKEESIRSWAINVTRDSESARWTLQVMHSNPAQPMVFH